MTAPFSPCPKPEPKAPASPRPIARRKPVRKRNAKRRGCRFPKLRDPLYRDWIRTFRCSIGQDCAGIIECAHLRTRGAGGPDRGNCIALCTRHHREQHAIGITSFQSKYGRDLKYEAQCYELRYPAGMYLQEPDREAADA